MAYHPAGSPYLGTHGSNTGSIGHRATEPVTAKVPPAMGVRRMPVGRSRRRKYRNVGERLIRRQPGSR
jgi:hypothetical protein